MLPNTDKRNSEEFIFYIDLITNFLKKKSVMKAINSFIKEKDKYNALSTYGVVLFQKGENPVNEYDLKDSDSLLNVIDGAWETRELEKSFLENGLYEILAYIFRKSRTSRKNYRVIIISDTPSKLSDDYYNALYDLLIKAKKFSAFIDIIRVGDEKFYEDDVKLKVISSETQGGMFYCQNEKLLQNILGSLIQNKSEFKVLKTEESDQILGEDKVFYERLAVDLISLSADDEEICTICEQELCPICEAHSDEIHKCFNCDAKFHSCCAAKYALVKNIGFNHLFRCP
ncbi:MAG: VWA domain-containing protein, partial [Candidatus Lokiarchaeota archaeon]|nr:VWA domain-containing protein [Candidatus Lokiarchaeota archaeon]